jgi:acyl-CoA synthetase (AMP-forming)/AMP-acid ligase II
MGEGPPSPMTTRFTCPVGSIADVVALERSPYDALVPARNLHQLFEATARLHPDRQAQPVPAPRESREVSLTHRQLLVDISRAANLFGASGIRQDGPTVAFLCPSLPQVFPTLLGAQVAGVASDLAVREKVRTEVDRIFGPATATEIQVNKNDKFDTVVCISVESIDEAALSQLAESLSALPQTDRVESTPP